MLGAASPTVGAMELGIRAAAADGQASGETGEAGQAQKPRVGKKRTGASKYDMVKVKVQLGHDQDHYYVLSRFLISRMLTLARVPHAKATKIALELKKLLVDNDQLNISQAELEAALFGIMEARGFGQSHVAVYHMVSRFLAARRPLVILLIGPPWSGKSTLAQQLAARLNMPNVLPTSVIYEMLRASRLANLQPEPVWCRRDINSYSQLVSEFVVEAAAVRTALEGDLTKALSDGKPLIIEGSHLDLGALLPELSTRGLVLLPATAAGCTSPLLPEKQQLPQPPGAMAHTPSSHATATPCHFRTASLGEGHEHCTSAGGSLLLRSVSSARHRSDGGRGAWAMPEPQPVTTPCIHTQLDSHPIRDVPESSHGVTGEPHSQTGQTCCQTDRRHSVTGGSHSQTGGRDSATGERGSNEVQAATSPSGSVVPGTRSTSALHSHSRGRSALSKSASVQEGVGAWNPYGAALNRSSAHGQLPLLPPRSLLTTHYSTPLPKLSSNTSHQLMPPKWSQPDQPTISLQAEEPLTQQRQPDDNGLHAIKQGVSSAANTAGLLPDRPGRPDSRLLDPGEGHSSVAKPSIHPTQSLDAQRCESCAPTKTTCTIGGSTRSRTQDLSSSASLPALATWGSAGLAAGGSCHHSQPQVQPLGSATDFPHAYGMGGKQSASQMSRMSLQVDAAASDGENLLEGAPERLQCASPVMIDPQCWASAPLFIPIILQVESRYDHALIQEDCTPEASLPSLTSPLPTAPTHHPALHGLMAPASGPRPVPVAASTRGLATPSGTATDSPARLDDPQHGLGGPSLASPRASHRSLDVSGEHKGLLSDVATEGAAGSGSVAVSTLLLGLSKHAAPDGHLSEAGAAAAAPVAMARPGAAAAAVAGSGGAAAGGATAAGATAAGATATVEAGGGVERAGAQGVERCDVGHLQRARMLQEYHASYGEQGVPVIQVRYGAAHDALDALHEHTLNCITTAVSWMQQTAAHGKEAGEDIVG